MDMNAMGNGKWMTYAELGELIGGTPEAGRQIALRLKLRKQIGNEDKRARVWVEEDTLPRRANRPTPVQTPVDPPVQTPVHEHERTGEINALQAHLETLERLLVQQREGHTAEVDRLREDLEHARQDVNQWRDDANRERQRANVMFDQIKDLTDRLDQLHQDRQADIDRLRTALEDARRPWWRRLTGR
jgi:outer membrane murein-binding lipoprotein Lpp